MANFNASILLDVKTTASERKVKRLERGIAKVENATRDILIVDKQIVRERRALLRLSGEQAAKSKRRSPSRFIRNLFGQARKQIEAQVDAAIASGVWAIAGNIQQFTWDKPATWRWITKEDEMVCDVCRPLNDVIFDEPKEKAHWACRCECLPAPSADG